MKIQAKEEKEKDRKKSQEDAKYYVWPASSTHYPMHIGQRDVLLKKLMLLHFNLDSLGDTKVAYYLWDETRGKRGPCEVAICSMKNIMSVCSPSNEIKEVTYYSDTSGRQNRNQYVVTSFLYTLSRTPSLKKLNHKFLQSRHSHMEYD
jgi:hypothetical protein